MNGCCHQPDPQRGRAALVAAAKHRWGGLQGPPRGALFTLPAGYILTEDNRPERHPDEEVRAAISEIFRSFRDTGNAWRRIRNSGRRGSAILHARTPLHADLSNGPPSSTIMSSEDRRAPSTREPTPGVAGRRWFVSSPAGA